MTHDSGGTMTLRWDGTFLGLRAMLERAVAQRAESLELAPGATLYDVRKAFAIVKKLRRLKPTVTDTGYGLLLVYQTRGGRGYVKLRSTD